MFKLNCHIFHDNSEKSWGMITIDKCRYTMDVFADNCDNDVIDDVIMCKNRSKFRAVLTLLVFELQRKWESKT